MSIDLDWHRLDHSLSSSLVDLLNRQLATTARPSFIGPVEVTSLEFGTSGPDVELVDLCDIYRDFLEDDAEDEDAEPAIVKVTEGAPDDEGFEWVSRRVARSQSLAEELPPHSLLPPHMRYGHGPVADMFSSVPNLHGARGAWSPALGGGLPEMRPLFPYASGYASPLARAPLSALTPRTSFGSVLNTHFVPDDPSPLKDAPDDDMDSRAASPAPDAQGDGTPPPTQPNVQLHLHIAWQSNLRITFTTSLLINYPSPMFMSLPIKLSVTGLVFNGEVVVAYEGERRRVHVCVVDDLDPYGPLSGERHKRDTPSSTGTPAEQEEDAAQPKPSKPLPIGQRLLPNIFIESEIGQADKHVLKNVTRVERFIQDVIRKTVEEELVFPNFHTLVLPDPA
ncbi:mitochondrial distribution and morphology protein [Phanerochaete sordida]|uniref:Mitochondrial distribution and morphology protein 12 n=1 Tax=Phanerochaete sordida TaxID=48140 RepID=A0A9P3G125_9APHY|nr:mitochondrial distribution and morphology protein [Phanerochaete sordida]